MLSRLSHPLAFATAPLDGTTPEYGGESFFVVGDDTANISGMGDTIVPITRSMAGTMINPRPAAGATGLPGSSELRDPRKTLEEYSVENRQLKIALDQLSRKLAAYKDVYVPLFFSDV